MRQDILNELSKMYAITYSLSKQSNTITQSKELTLLLMRIHNLHKYIRAS